MAKQITAAMQNYLAGDAVQLATFWRLTRVDGKVLGFTDWDQDVAITGTTYMAASGLTRSALQQRHDLSIAGLEAGGMLSAAAITDEDIRAGRYNGATIQMWLAVPTDANFLTYGTVPLPGAFIGEITIKDGVFVAEVRGLGYALQQTFIEVFTPLCRADFGDSRCKLDLAPFTDTGSVTSVIVASKVIAVSLNSTHGLGRYNFGLITFTSGANSGLAVEVRNWSGGTGTTGNITLYLGAGKPLQAGDTFRLVPGCDKTFNPQIGQGCFLWNNTVNFRGEPFIPGTNFQFDYATQTP